MIQKRVLLIKRDGKSIQSIAEIEQHLAPFEEKILSIFRREIPLSQLDQNYSTFCSVLAADLVRFNFYSSDPRRNVNSLKALGICMFLSATIAIYYSDSLSSRFFTDRDPFFLIAINLGLFFSGFLCLWLTDDLRARTAFGTEWGAVFNKFFEHARSLDMTDESKVPSAWIPIILADRLLTQETIDRIFEHYKFPVCLRPYFL